MRDEMVASAQTWLNETYGMNLEVNGHTGTIVMEALVTALQIDLGVSSPTGYFGDTTAALYAPLQITLGSYDTPDLHLVEILQYGFYCKGYNAGEVNGIFHEDTLTAVRKVQADAGLSSAQISDIVTPRVFKAILSSDALVLISGGNAIIRSIQQALNRKYIDYIGIMPCDGMYGAGLAKSLIYALQAEGGMDTSTANGNFGPGTQTIATNHPQSTSHYEENFVLIAKYALYCNGVKRNGSNQFDTTVNGTFSGVYDSAMASAVTGFQQFTAIMEVTGTIGIREWMSLLVSTGYPTRNVLACDTSTQITDVKAQRIVANDFTVIGRYLTGSTVAGPKNLTRSELNILFNRNLRVFVIYQDEKAYYDANPDEYTTENYYDYDQGYGDAGKACNAAIALGIPYGEYIFFSVDYDFTDYQVLTKIIQHFTGVNEYVRKHGSKYKIGIYGPRNACTRVSNASLASLSFVSDMSTGYSGNLGYRLPENWAFDQIREYTQGAVDGGFNLDCVAASGRYMGFNSILPESVPQPEVDSEELARRYYNRIINSMGIDIDFAPFGWQKTFPFGTFDVTIDSKYGAEVDVGRTDNMMSLNIADGEFEDVSWPAVESIMEGISAQLSAGLTVDGKFTLAEQFKWEIEDGYIEFSIKLTSDNKLEASFVLHKNASVDEGIETYVEIGMTLTSNSNLTPEEVDLYNQYKVCVDITKVIESLVNTDWEKVIMISFAISLLAFLAAGLIVAPEITLPAATIIAVIIIAVRAYAYGTPDII